WRFATTAIVINVPNNVATISNKSNPPTNNSSNSYIKKPNVKAKTRKYCEVGLSDDVLKREKNVYAVGTEYRLGKVSAK
ncbi:MAG: hypothetical protein KBS89_05265, partial [Bacteroidales bacterium]|nr:hypothetical protein [Candidatus Egerieousia equi]